MKQVLIILLNISILLLGCSTNNSNNTNKKNLKQETSTELDNHGLPLRQTKQSDTIDLQESVDKITVTMTPDSSYCYIKEIINQNNQTYLKVDFIQFFMFDEALQEAKKRGDAEYEIEENGDTTYFVYNDYYIANDNPKLRQFKISERTNIELLEVFGDTTICFSNTKKATKRIENSPFKIVTKDGEITQLKEVYTP